MSEDLNLHVEAMRTLFKKRFSGEIVGHLGDKSPDIFKGKDDINIKDIDWNEELISINYVDEFPHDLSHYIRENNLNIETVEKIIEIFKQKTKNFDERIWDRLDIILEQWDGYILENQMTDKEKELLEKITQGVSNIMDDYVNELNDQEEISLEELSNIENEISGDDKYTFELQIINMLKNLK